MAQRSRIPIRRVQPIVNQKYYLARIDAALAKGELWRAKDICHGAIRNEPYDPALYERYGQVLITTGDLADAGKYLFLSGRRKPEYQEAIDLYMRRHAKQGFFRLVSTFPKQARKVRMSTMPDAVQKELLKLRPPLDTGWEIPVGEPPPPPISRAKAVRQLIAFLAVCLFIIITIVIGVVVEVRAIMHWVYVR